MGVLITGVATGAAARWTSSVGGPNSRQTQAYYRYDPAIESNEGNLLKEAKHAFVRHLGSERIVGRRIASNCHEADYLYLFLDSVTAKVVKPGVISLVAMFGGSGQEPQTTGVTSDTVMIYTKGAVDQLYPNKFYGFPDETLINQDIDEDPMNINLDVHRIDAFQRSPFTRSMISYKPTIIDYRGAIDQSWANKVGRTNANIFSAYLGDDFGVRYFGANRVRLNGLTTVPKPLLSQDGGVAWATTFDFTICSTQFVDQGIEVFEETGGGDDPRQRAKIVYLDQYERVGFPTFYTP